MLLPFIFIVINSSEHCNSDLDCVPSYGDRTICLNNKCGCKQYHHQQNVGHTYYQCVKNRGLYENCMTDEDCYYGLEQLDKIRCKLGVCKCVNDYHVRGRKCSEYKTYSTVKL